MELNPSRIDSSFSFRVATVWYSLVCACVHVRAGVRARLEIHAQREREHVLFSSSISFLVRFPDCFPEYSSNAIYETHS